MQNEIQVRAASQTLKRMAVDPITWVPFLPFAAAYSFMGAPWWACVTGAVLATGGVIAWWGKHWSALCRSAEVTILQDQAAADNMKLQSSLGHLAQRLQAQGDGDLARKLPDFLRHKQSIDAAIFEDHVVTGVEAEIAGMIADLSHAWMNDVDKLAGGNLPEREHERMRLAIDKGLAVIRKTRDEIDILIRPTHGLDPGHESVAAERAQRLEDRIDEARNIRDRLVRDLKSDEEIRHTESPRITQ